MLIAMKAGLSQAIPMVQRSRLISAVSRAVVWARDEASLDDGLDGLPILLVTLQHGLIFPSTITCPAGRRPHGSGAGTGFGASYRRCRPGFVIETPLAGLRAWQSPLQKS